MKRRQIRIIINKDYLMQITLKNSQPKIKVSQEESIESLAIIEKNSNSLFFLKSELSSNLSLFNKKKKLHMTELEKSLDFIQQNSEISMNLLNISPKNHDNSQISFLKEQNSLSDIVPSMNEIDMGSNENLKEIEENTDKNKKKKNLNLGINILSPVKLVNGMKRFQNQIIENKKKIETKSDLNQLNYTPFFFTRFFAGKLRKWRVKFCKFKGFFEFLFFS